MIMSSPASRSVTAASGQLQQRQVSTIQDQSEHRKRTLEDIGRNNHIDNNNNNNNISISKQDRETNLNEMIDQEQEQGSGTPSKNHKQFVEKKRQDSPDSACGSTSTTVYLDDSGNGRASKTGSCGSETNDDGYNKSRPAAAATTVTFQEDQTEANDRSNVRQNGHNKNSTGGHGAGGDIGGGKSICNKPARLLHEIREPLKLKNFSEEIRGAMDVEQSVCQSELLLDCRESSIEGIVGAMLLRVSSSRLDSIDISESIFKVELFLQLLSININEDSKQMHRQTQCLTFNSLDKHILLDTNLATSTDQPNKQSQCRLSKMSPSGRGTTTTSGELPSRWLGRSLFPAHVSISSFATLYACLYCHLFSVIRSGLNRSGSPPFDLIRLNLICFDTNKWIRLRGPVSGQ